jgi:glucose/arabinose dehydrogenase
MQKYVRKFSCWLAVAVFMATTVVSAQNLFVSSDSGNKIYKITLGGTVTTFFTQTTDVGQLAFNSAGNLFEGAGSQILEFSPAGTERTFATGLVDIGGLAFNSAGDLFVSDFNAIGSIIEITPGGVKSTFASGLDEPRGLTFNSAGNLFVGTGNNITEITPEGAKSIFASGVNVVNVNSLAFNYAGNLFVESDNQIILEITPNGTQSTFAPLGADQQMAFDSQGMLFVANENNEGVLEYNSSGKQSTFVPGLGEAIGLAFQPVPEPPTFGLLGVGAAALVVFRRRL